MYAQNHRSTFSIPTRPFVSSRCQHLIASLIQDKGSRLCSRRYQFKDMQYQSQQASDRPAQTNFADRFVFPYDAEDLKAHRWFKGVPWERLHEIDPPFVPMIRSPDDTQYFNDEEPITDLSDSADDEDQALPEQETPTAVLNTNAAIGRDGADDKVTTIPMGPFPPTPPTPPTPMAIHMQKTTPQSAKSSVRNNITAISVIAAAASNGKRVDRSVHLAQALDGFDPSIKQAVHSWLAVPYDSIRLRNFELQVEAEAGLRASQRTALKALVRLYGRKERKRPRDKLLRDPSTKKAVLKERKKSAFLGYDWQRNQALPVFSETLPTMMGGTQAWMGSLPPLGLCVSATIGSGLGDGGRPKGDGEGLWPCLSPGHEHLAAVRTLQRGRLSMN